MAKKRKLTKSRKAKGNGQNEGGSDSIPQKHTETELLTAAIDSSWTDTQMRILWQTRLTQNQIIHRIAGTGSTGREI